MTNSSEAWLAHPVHTHIEVSNLGRVRTIDHVGDGIVGRKGWRYKSRILSPSLDSCGYPMVCISPKMRRVHHLVAETFIGPRPDGAEVMHLDANRANPRADNLRYGTRSENQRQAVSDGNHHLTRRTECLRGHRLAHPNLQQSGLRRGKRLCRACNLAKNWCAKHPDDRPNFEAIADRYYLNLP